MGNMAKACYDSLRIKICYSQNGSPAPLNFVTPVGNFEVEPK